MKIWNYLDFMDINLELFMKTFNFWNSSWKSLSKITLTLGWKWKHEKGIRACSTRDIARQHRCFAVHIEKLFSHVLFVSIYRNCEIGIKLVSRVQLPVEASLEKLFTSKIRICINRLLANRVRGYLRQN